MPHVIDEMLDVIRHHLDMDVAFVGTFDGERRVFTNVSAREPEARVRVGASDPLESSLCIRIADGSLAPLTGDATADPVARDLPITDELGIRGYAGVPITLRDGTTYGTLCAFKRTVHAFDGADVHALQLAAGLIAHRLQSEALLALADRDRRAALVDEIERGQTLTSAYQPIVELRSGVVRGFEALARFEHDEVRDPGAWFDMGRRLGFDVVLQRQAARSALAGLPAMPEAAFLALNLGEDALADDGVRQLLLDAGPDASRLVVELTEHQSHRDDGTVLDQLAELRRAGIRLAIDDVGAGYAGLHRVLAMQPDMIKLDRGLVAGVADDPGRQAMAQAFTTFARATGVEVIAEGIEDPRDLDALRVLGVQMGQGFLLGRPEPAAW